jgi:antitoxin HicB
MKSGLNQDRVSGTPAATGEEAAEALTQAVDALESAVSMYIEDRRDIPKPSPVKPRGKAVILPALTEAKLALDSTMRANRVGKAELARRLNCHLPQVDRLLDLLHASRLDQLEAAFRVLGKRLDVEIREAA